MADLWDLPKVLERMTLDDLNAAVRAGRIAMWGLREARGDLRLIPKAERATLAISEDGIARRIVQRSHRRIASRPARTWAGLYFDAGDVLRVRPDPAPKNKGGGHQVADWHEIEDLLAAKIRREGYPSRERPKGWQTQADVIRWASDQLALDNTFADPSTVKKQVGPMLKRLSNIGE